MSELAIDDFSRFMVETTGFDPFPWQTRLLAEVLDDPEAPCWPDLLDLPTGTGKTSALHIAVFALALRPRVMPRRIVLVVDRRVIVDQVHRVASHLAATLDQAVDGVAARVAERLRACSAVEDPSPLRASLLRGGIPRDDSWIESPEQPTIFASTVDQVGSRLLFRGYGVSPGMRPIHAGVLGTDTIYLLDEVHLASAFEKTLSDLAAYSRPKWREHAESVGRPIQVVRMSATPRRTAATRSVFSLDNNDKEHTVLQRRLEASRPATLQLIKTKVGATRSNQDLVVRAAINAANEFVQEGARLVGLVMNRVALAVATARELEQRARPGRVLLITGRMRPLERAQVQAQIDELASSGSERSGDEPTFVVATSCIEAGADYDFDALVTQVASLPALRQRFGRLNRLGDRLGAAACILGSKDQLSKSAKPDPIYGEALSNTWHFLQQHAADGVVDFGLTRFPDVDAETMASLRTADVPPPTMFPNYLDLWSETRPAPHPDPDVSLWLHGAEHHVDEDVSVVFRADVTMPTDDAVDVAISESLEFIPPLAEEALSVPVWQLRDFARSRSEREDPSVLVWTSDGAQSRPVDQLKVGDVVVVPSAWGGLTMGSWDRDSLEAVADIAEQAYLARFEGGHGHHGLFLRANDEVLPAGSDVPIPPSDEVGEEPEAWDHAMESIRAWLGRDRDRDEWLPRLLRVAKAAALEVDIQPAVSGSGWFVSWRSPRHGLYATTDDSVSSFSGIEVSLADHLDDVRAWSRGFGERAGLTRPLADDVALAGWLHDIGKADRRFQVLLRGGDPVAAYAKQPLAKSGTRGSARTRERARARSGWPVGFRHELISLALFDSNESIQARAHDVELVRHLIASHHGWCRPWSPALDDPEPLLVEFDLDGVTFAVETSSVDESLRLESASRFRRLCRRYGWHGLAYLEALLRLGDHQASRSPSTRPREVSS